MNGKTYPYLDLATLAPVGGALLDARPAVVFAADGTRLLWANAAGAAFFGEERMGDLLDRRIGGLNPLKAQTARLVRVLPADASRIEILRVGQGVSFASLPAACQRLSLADGANAVFAIGLSGGTPESLSTRAERLADAIAGNDCLAAVLDRDGKVLGASGGFDELSAAEADIDALIDAARSAGAVKRRLAVAAGERPAGAVRFLAEGRECFLLIVGPVEATHAAPPPAPAAPEPEVPDPAPIEEIAEAVAPPSAEPASPPEPVVRFVFAIGADGRVIAVSPELAQVVGSENAAIAGLPWTAVADTLGLDADGTIGKALADAEPWSASVAWPAEAGETVAVDLTAFPAGADGFRGFGFCHPNMRRPDQRSAPKKLAEIVVAPVVPPAEPELMAESAAVVPAPPQSPEPLPAPPPQTVAPEAPKPPPAPPQPATIVDLDDVARKIIEEGAPARPSREQTAAPAAAPVSQPSNIVRLPSAGRTPPERLTGTEQDAFRRIAETLGLRQAEEARRAAEAEASAAEPAPPARREIVKAPASEIDTRLLDRLPIGLVVFREGKTLFANRMLLDLLGHDSFDGFVQSGGAEAVFPGGSEAWAGGIAETGGRLSAHRRDGETVPVDVRLHAVPWGTTTALMLSLSPRLDRTEGEAAKNISGELAASNAHARELEAILDTATDGVIVIDGVGKIGSMNRAGEALFGVEAGEWLGRSFTGLLAEESHKSALDYLDGLAANGVASVLNDGREVIGKVPAGGLIPLFMTMGRIGESDKFCAVLRDITHWKNVEEELVAARRAAETANAQKSDFLAKVSHEIRTPLNAIIGFSEVMMQERFGPIGNDRYRSYLRDIHVSGEHLMSLINDLLDLSKIEAGKLELSFEAVGVNAAIQECVALMQPQANRERIIIRTSLGADVPDVVADPRSLRQILLNLLSNAIKFTRAGGQVIVSSALEESGEVTVRIRDTGVGMSEKDIETALKPFRQVATAKSGEQRGTGLGLPLTKALVEANRASFAIDSAVEQGTLVRITFPTTRVLAG